MCVGSSLDQLKALDHNFHVAGIVPSVAFFPDIPKQAKDSFFSGSVFVTLKDKVLQPSHALHHSVELSNTVKSNFTKGDSNEPAAVALLISDGDHTTVSPFYL